MSTERTSTTQLPLSYYLDHEYRPLMEIFHWGTNLAGSVYTESTAVVPPDAAYASVALAPTHQVGQEFLLNYRRSSLDLALPIGIAAYFGFPVRSSLALRSLREEEDSEAPGEVVTLPPYQNVNESLGVTIRSRRSVREFTGKPLTLTQLSTVLFYANGVTGEQVMISDHGDPQWPKYSLGPPEPDHTTAASSGGGLNPISLYLVLQNVKDVADGIYVYLPVRHALKRVRTLDADSLEEHRTLGRSWGPNVDPGRVNVTVYYVYTVYENFRKYGDMGLVFAVVEAGEIAAHIHLTCTATTIGSSDMGGTEKVLTERFLGIDGLSQQVVHTTVIGSM